jgi:signal peptidase
MKNAIKKFRESDNYWVSLLRDLIFVAAVLIIFTSVSKIALGTYHPMVAVESSSMEPNMKVGDLIFIRSPQRGEIVTYVEGMKTNYKSFNDYGNVILYKKQGRPDVTPIIHRAMYYVKKGEPMWRGGPPAPYDGYITKGDNRITNQYYDQMGSISYHAPVREEWIVGVAVYRIPYIGYLPLIAHSALPLPKL